jgi:O-antigen biosynthesis protein
MKVCLVSNEILGAHRNGGIGTATSHLAVLLATNGHAVSLFYVGHTPLDLHDRWAAIYRVANIEVLHFPRSLAPIQPSWMKQPVGIFEQLRRKDFDVILFQDWMALGHACVIAKRAGIAFGTTTLATFAHGSTPWLLEANRAFPANPEQLALLHMEKQTIELSDALVSPSMYLRDWMVEAGWRLPDETSVIPLFIDALDLLGATPHLSNRMSRRNSRPAHLVFFGRLEERKGISIFLSALASEELKSFTFKLTFLGRPASKTVEEIRAFIGRARPDLLAEMEFRTNLSSDEAQAYLTETSCISVIPSLIDNSPCVIYESLKLGLPFIAAASGGITELVHSDDRARSLFAPNARALAKKLKEVLSAEYWDGARSAYNQHDISRSWLAWFEKLKPASIPGRSPAILKCDSDITVVVTHYERPRLLEQNLRALAVQSDRAFKVVLVDDGSRTEQAHAFLDRAEKGLGGLSIRVVRQENRYVGAARNEGLRHAETPYVIFLDDDNIPFPNMIEVFRHAAHMSDADIITCQMQFFHDALNEPNPQELITGERWSFSGGPVALGLLQNCFGDATAIYKRTVFEKTGPFHEIAGVTYEDWQLHLRACLAGCQLLSLPLALFWYRVLPDSMIRSTNQYFNMRAVASVFHRQVPANLVPIIDFIIGRQIET